MITIKGVSALSVPTPPLGKARLFLDIADNQYKIKKDNNLIVDLEAGGVGTVDAELVTYVTTDILLWSWATVVPVNAEQALDTLAGKVKEIDGLINDLAPAKPPLLSAVSLFVSAIYYTGKLPSGLPASWYTENAPGDVVNTVIYSPSFSINAGNFYVGKKDQPLTYGTLNYLLDAVVANSIDMTVTPIPATSGPLSITAINTINNFWTSADSSLAIVQANEGLATYQLQHTNSGSSPLVKTFWDNNAIAPTLGVALSVAQNTKVSKWLSGIEYYGLGSIFNVTYTIVNAFRKVYVPVGLTRISCTGVVNPFTIDPNITPSFTDSFVVTNSPVSLLQPNQANVNPVLTMTYAKPNNPNALSATFNIKAGLGLGINTYGTISTVTFEGFHDEVQRRYITGLAPFVSTAVLPNGEAQVRSGTLEYGSVDYPAKTGDQSYTRYFTKAAANSGTIVFGGLNVANIAPFGTGSLNVLLILETEGKYYDLGRPFGSNNGTGSGNSAANSKGARVTGAGNNLNFTFGTDTTSNNGNQYRILIIFRNNTYSITSLTTS